MENQELEIFKGAIIIAENEFVAVKPCCEFFGLDYGNQLERIKSDVLTSQLYGKNRIVAADGKARDMVCLTKSGFLRWVYTIQQGAIAGENGEKFVFFLKIIHEYLFGSLNPSIKHEQKQSELYRLRREIQYIEGQIELKKSETADLKEQLKQLNESFWELFNSNAVQLPIPFNNELPHG